MGSPPVETLAPDSSGAPALVSAHVSVPSLHPTKSRSDADEAPPTELASAAGQGARVRISQVAVSSTRTPLSPLDTKPT